jgi:hypothetical protein
MVKRSIIVISAVLLTLVFSPLAPGTLSAAQEETIVGTVVQHGKAFVIETDEGDYIVKGKDLSKLAGKMVEATGTISESEKGDMIDVKSVEEIEE